MPYRLQPGESVPGALRRSGREQLENAIGELTDGVKVDGVKAVHDGDDHDLAVLRTTPVDLAGQIPEDLDPVLGLIEHRRAQLQTEAMFLGERLYAEKPKPFVRRLRRYWRAWRDETRAAASHRPVELAEAAEG